VGHEDDREAPLQVEPLELVVEQVPGDGVEGAEGLVHEQHVGVLAQRPGQGDALAHAAGQLVGPLLGEAVQVDGAQQLEGAGPALGLALAREPLRQLDVPGDGQPGEERRLLEHDPGLAAGRLRARGGLIEVGDQVEQGRLPAPGCADEAHELSGLDVEVDAVEGEY
jgi:hypothetical protein